MTREDDKIGSFLLSKQQQASLKAAPVFPPSCDVDQRQEKHFLQLGEGHRYSGANSDGSGNKRDAQKL